ncbi:DRTGG domain-containing protein [Bacillus kwashiorkori]|uniref:DRTGG domain-containing protein n=1 Tax=Bacillus kwashiorkori TaxID=1522318 RepID=UPI0007865E28|nr:DRTGG domain-containing protein [Bacillus kwashiorkori]
MTKHELILKYIEDLPVGGKISVRQIAKDLNVSEGTAYRAIKEAENKGFVSTIERVGTIRIEQKRKENIEKLTFAEVVNIVDGQVLGGKSGLHKTLNKFLIGAMKLEDMLRYIEAGNLLIIGNRSDAQKEALKKGAAILITGGFNIEEEVKKLADEFQLPVISTSYDSFTVATIINRAIYDQLIKKDILLVEDILIPKEDTYYLFVNDKVEKWHELNKISSHTRFPVVDQQLKVEGMITSKDVINQEKKRLVEKIMTKNPIVTNSNMSVASASHLMIWEGIDLLPVVDEQNRLRGIITRRDVLKALQTSQRQPHVGETIDDIISNNLTTIDDNDHLFTFEISPQMTNHHGTLSYGVLTSIVIESASRTFRLTKRGNFVADHLMIYFIKPVQIDGKVEVSPKILDMGRKFGKIDVEVFHEGQIIAKAMMTFQFIDR